MNSVVGLTGALGLGAGLAYFLDPDRGRARRARLSDQLVSAAHTAGDAADATSRDLGHRALGTLAAVRSRLTPDDADDDVVVERVRARMGSAVRNARTIDVFSENGRVTMRGHVLAREVGPLIRRVSAVRGVRSIDNQLEVHRDADIPELQGAEPRRHVRSRWTTAGRVVTAAIGAVLALWGIREEGPIRTTVGLTGLALAGTSIFGRRPPLRVVTRISRAA